MYRFAVLCFVCVCFVSGCSSDSMSLSRLPSEESGDYYDALRMETAGTADFAFAAMASSPQEIQTIQNPEVDPARLQRLVVYNAVMNVVVERISDSISRIESVVVGMGGYMQEMTGSSITLKVPADRFQDAIAEVEKLGEVIGRDIKGTDVTEEMRDLNIRLENAERAREKMMSLLEQPEEVEDILAIEKELERITETIETLKGKISYLQNRISFSTLTVRFNSPVPQEDLTNLTPFTWVRVLGSEMTRPVRPRTSAGSWLFNSKMFTLPEEYIRYYQDNISTRAMSANGVMIYVHKEENFKGGNVEFWTSLVRRVLLERQTININRESELKLKNKKDAILFKGSKQIGSREYGYLVALAPAKNNIYIFEAWGLLQEFETDEAKLEEAVLSMRMQ